VTTKRESLCTSRKRAGVWAGGCACWNETWKTPVVGQRDRRDVRWGRGGNEGTAGRQCKMMTTHGNVIFQCTCMNCHAGRYVGTVVHEDMLERDGTRQGQKPVVGQRDRGRGGNEGTVGPQCKMMTTHGNVRDLQCTMPMHMHELPGRCVGTVVRRWVTGRKNLLSAGLRDRRATDAPRDRRNENVRLDLEKSVWQTQTVYRVKVDPFFEFWNQADSNS
jgi:hypothetical protein